MAITTAICSSYKQQLFLAEHDMDTHTIKAALYSSSATLSAATTAYSSTNEITGTGYTAGGSNLDSPTVSLSGTTAFVDFADESWTVATFTTRGVMIYNDTHSGNAAISVHDFGSDKSVTAGTFTLQFPTADASNAIIRIA